MQEKLPENHSIDTLIKEERHKIAETLYGPLETADKKGEAYQILRRANELLDLGLTEMEFPQIFITHNPQQNSGYNRVKNIIILNEDSQHDANVISEEVMHFIRNFFQITQKQGEPDSPVDEFFGRLGESFLRHQAPDLFHLEPRNWSKEEEKGYKLIKQKREEIRKIKQVMLKHRKHVRRDLINKIRQNPENRWEIFCNFVKTLSPKLAPVYLVQKDLFKNDGDLTFLENEFAFFEHYNIFCDLFDYSLGKMDILAAELELHKIEDHLDGYLAAEKFAKRHPEILQDVNKFKALLKMSDDEIRQLE